MDWKTFAWLRRGKRRTDVLKIIAKSKQPLAINDIKNILKIAISQASFTTNELYEQKLIECLNPEDKIGKLYIKNYKGYK